MVTKNYNTKENGKNDAGGKKKKPNENLASACLQGKNIALIQPFETAGDTKTGTMHVMTIY